MNPVLPARKRAEQFSSMVEGSSTTQPDAGPYADLVPLVGLVTSLRSTPPVEPRPEFVAGLRERLMLAAETALVPDTADQAEARRQPPARRTARERRLAVAVGGFALVSASASMSVAAQTALPGDTLYPLKRALEDVHENVLRDADDKGATMLDNASSRLDEVDELSRGGSQEPDVIAQTLQDFSDQAVEASGVLIDDFERTGRPSSIEELRTFTASSLDVLQQLRSVVPAEVRADLVQAAAVLDEIDRRARSLCPQCSDLPAVDEISTAAATLGPLYSALVDPPAAKATPAAPDAKPATKPRKPSASGQPTPPTSTTAPTPTTREDPPSLTPPDTKGGGTGGGTGAGGNGTGGGGVVGTTDAPGSLPEVVGDLGEVLTGVTDTVDGVLGGLTGQTPTP
jgi:hypothetical protein